MDDKEKLDGFVILSTTYIKNILEVIGPDLNKGRDHIAARTVVTRIGVVR